MLEREDCIVLLYNVVIRLIVYVHNMFSLYYNIKSWINIVLYAAIDQNVFEIKKR